LRNEGANGITYHGDCAADEDEAAGLDGLAVDAGERLGGLVGKNGDLLVRHDGCVCAEGLEKVGMKLNWKIGDGKSECE
jgi:hypothetical protein